MATGSAGGLTALSGRPAGTTPLHDFNRENLPHGQDALTTRQSQAAVCDIVDHRVRHASRCCVDRDEGNANPAERH
jgi:hypothetical protein